jgi:hypothetical protein
MDETRAGRRRRTAEAAKARVAAGATTMATMGSHGGRVDDDDDDYDERPGRPTTKSARGQTAGSGATGWSTRRQTQQPTIDGGERGPANGDPTQQEPTDEDLVGREGRWGILLLFWDTV